MHWLKEYQDKKKDAATALGIIKSGDRVYLAGNAATPYALLEVLAKRKEELHNVELVHALLAGAGESLTSPDMAGHFTHNGLFLGGGDRALVNEGRAGYVPVILSEIPALFRDGYLPIDVAMLQTSAPDEFGFLSLGVEVLTNKVVVETAKHVIVQINPRMPRSLGNSFIHISQVHAIVEQEAPLFQLPRPKVTDVERKISEHVASIVEDGATLQLGIGGIPDAVLSLLSNRRDLGIHTEMISDGLMEAIEKGIITGAKKTLHKGKVIATFILGSNELYKFANNNPLFELHPVDYTNNPFIISQNDKMTAINSAIEVDLTGQVCADSIGTTIYSGFGGQLDFVRGATRAKGGKPVIALSSTTQNGKVSRIVAMLKPGAGVVTTRGDVRYVATEYGIVNLYGKNIQQRAKTLIEIAHPDFREELTKAAWERKLLTKYF
jgi:acyl-CoA hydrolase